MRSMAIDRRTLLKALAIAPLSTSPALAALPERRPVYLSAFSREGAHRAAIHDGRGEILAIIELPARGHGGAFRPNGGDGVVFARRPGDFALVFERGTGRVKHRLNAPEGHHFYGHGTFSADGRLLFATENDYEAARGVLGVFDAADGYRRVGALETYGIGPHDIALTADRRTLAIANGGIETHPDSGRLKLNIPDMSPSLVLLDPNDGGARLSETKLPAALHKLSIRHLAVNADGVVAAAMQYEGPAEDTPPLVFLAGRRTLQLLQAPEPLQTQMRNYCGSVAFDRSGGILAASSPRGALVTFWSAEDGAFLTHLEFDDGCGLAPGERTGQFWVSGGSGTRALYDAKARRVIRQTENPAARWDNHIVSSAGLS